MVKPALAATRAVRVLDFLALHPAQAFSLKEIASACDVNAASLLAVLIALVDGGYLLRHPDHKTYTIGPGVVGLANAAAVQHPTIDAARTELPLLATDLKAECTASVLMGRTLVAVAIAGTARRGVTFTQTGMQLPFTAPFGAPFAAYGGEELREAWLRGSDGSPDQRTRALQKTLDDIRHRGFSVVAEHPARAELASMLHLHAEEPGNLEARRRVDLLLDDLADSLLDVSLERRKRFELATINVPVFSPAREVVMILTANGFGGSLTLNGVTDIAERMASSARSIALRAFGSLGPPRIATSSKR